MKTIPLPVLILSLALPLCGAEDVLLSMPHFDFADAGPDNPMPHFETHPEELALFEVYQREHGPLYADSYWTDPRGTVYERNGRVAADGRTWLRDIEQFEHSKALNLLARKWARWYAQAKVISEYEREPGWPVHDYNDRNVMHGLDQVGPDYFLKGVGVILLGGEISPTRLVPEIDENGEHVMAPWWNDFYNTWMDTWTYVPVQMPTMRIVPTALLHTTNVLRSGMIVADSAEEAWAGIDDFSQGTLGRPELKGSFSVAAYESNFYGIGYYPGNPGEWKETVRYRENEDGEMEKVIHSYHTGHKAVYVVLTVNAFTNPDAYLWKPAWVRAVMRFDRRPRDLIESFEHHRHFPFPEADVIAGERWEGRLSHPNLGEVSTLGLDSQWVHFHNGLGPVQVRSVEHTSFHELEHNGLTWRDFQKDLYDRDWPLDARWILPGTLAQDVWVHYREVFPGDPEWDRTTVTLDGARDRHPELYDMRLDDPAWLTPQHYDDDDTDWREPAKQQVDFTHQDRRYVVSYTRDESKLVENNLPRGWKGTRGYYDRDIVFTRSDQSEGFWGYVPPPRRSGRLALLLHPGPVPLALRPRTPTLDMVRRRIRFRPAHLLRPPQRAVDTVVSTPA
jgi:hypothetical protein